MSCLSGSRGDLVSFKAPDSHLGVHVCTDVYTGLFWAQRERPEAPVRELGHL